MIRRTLWAYPEKLQLMSDLLIAGFLELVEAAFTQAYVDLCPLSAFLTHHMVVVAVAIAPKLIAHQPIIKITGNREPFLNKDLSIAIDGGEVSLATQIFVDFSDSKRTMMLVKIDQHGHAKLSRPKSRIS